MDLIKFLVRSSRRMTLAIVLSSILSGALGAGLIAIINRAIAEGGSLAGILLVGFVAAVLAKIATQATSQFMLVHYAQETVLRLCRNLCKAVLDAPFEKLEAMGSPRLHAAFTDDISVLSAAVQSVPMIATSFAVVLGCSVYLAWLSLPVFLASASAVVIGILGYRVLLLRSRAAIKAARDGRDRLFGDFRALVDGVKELKLHRERRREFIRSTIDETTEYLRRQNVAATLHFLLADAWSQLLFFGLIGMLLFTAQSIDTLSTEALTGYIFAALYMMGPIWGLIGTVPTFMRGRVALARIRELGATLGTPVREDEDNVIALPVTPVRIEFDRVSFVYATPGGGDQGFTLGPIDLAFSSGEVVFVTGGNGSGKSTLVKLLTGLYAPQSGNIRLNGRAIDDSSREQYRQYFTAVFADFYLFDRLFGVDAVTRGPEIQQYLALLGMDRKVRVLDDKFTTTALSSGQRRRLALLGAYLEDRPVYVFDEWAADQDPSYKEIFYLRLLPELRARGKCVIVITHDDRYFRFGDRVLKLEAGRIVDERAGRGKTVEQAHSA